MLDAVGLEPGADVAAVTTVQIREVVEQLVATLTAWRNSTHLLPWQVRNAAIDKGSSSR